MMPVSTLITTKGEIIPPQTTIIHIMLLMTPSVVSVEGFQHGMMAEEVVGTGAVVVVAAEGDTIGVMVPMCILIIFLMPTKGEIIPPHTTLPVMAPMCTLILFLIPTKGEIMPTQTTASHIMLVTLSVVLVEDFQHRMMAEEAVDTAAVVAVEVVEAVEEAVDTVAVVVAAEEDAIVVVVVGVINITCHADNTQHHANIYS